MGGCSSKSNGSAVSVEPLGFGNFFRVGWLGNVTVVFDCRNRGVVWVELALRGCAKETE